MTESETLICAGFSRRTEGICALLCCTSQLTCIGGRAAGVGGGVGKVGGEEGVSLGDSSKLTGSLPATIEQTGWVYSPPLLQLNFVP